ncbi:BlaI/MecI/CopY family transcriptional regulator [Arenimonas composti]|uniref:BlaI/MecI/CopY family transcriptional regulator n=1 Tax=Arenimonas composti TaxID=370776 RepID=UPI00047BF08D|nr:BlaI/MecI/CopY family transcriptional regulator [Arenimonas composti]
MQISEAESAVMLALWEAGEATADDLIARVAAANDWAEPTVRTLLNRLLGKGAISAEKEGRRYRYRPVLQREDWVQAQSRGIVDRLFGGRIAPLVAHFGERGELSRDDIAELRRLIEDLDDGR